MTGRRPPRPGETKRQGQRFRLRRGGQRPREVRRFPRHGVEAGKGESERGLLQRPQEDGHGWCSCAGQAGSSRRLPQASAHPKARAQVPAAGAGRRLTACAPTAVARTEGNPSGEETRAAQLRAGHRPARSSEFTTRAAHPTLY